MMPYISLGETAGVFTEFVPRLVDGVSRPIFIDFPLGTQREQTVYVRADSIIKIRLSFFDLNSQVGTNGYFTFDGFTGYESFVFNEHSPLPLVAPFFADIDISSGVGRIGYEIHTQQNSENILSQISAVINENHNTRFQGKWLLVATWDGVPPFSGFGNIVSRTSHRILRSILTF